MFRFSHRRVLHAAAFLLALFLSLGIFFVALLLVEAMFYAVTGHPVSMAALVLAALFAVLLFLPLVQTMQHGLDRLFFRQYVDALQAIRHLGAGDLAELPAEGIELALLERICMVSHRAAAALVEQRGEAIRTWFYTTDRAAAAPCRKRAVRAESRITQQKGAGVALSRFARQWIADR